MMMVGIFVDYAGGFPDTRLRSGRAIQRDRSKTRTRNKNL
jgi:hypothetical protein